MKKTILSIVFGAVALVLTGCADHYPAYMAQAQKTDEANKGLVTQYFAAQSARDSVIMTSMAQKSDPTAMILYGFLQAERDAKLVNAMKGSTIKAPKTGMDIADTFVGNTVPTLIRWGAGYLMADSLIDAIGKGVTVGGDYVSVSNSGNGDGGFNWNDSSINDSYNTFETYQWGDGDSDYERDITETENNN